MTERTAQACQPVKLEFNHDWRKTRKQAGTIHEFQFVPPGGLDPAPLPVKIQQAHLAAKAQNEMAMACAIASELGKDPEVQDPQVFKRLLDALGTDPGGAQLELLKLVQRIGLRQWFDGDYVVLSMREACDLADHLAERGTGSSALDCAIQKASQ